jgi:bacteriocin biosynthesis cyclodehydratase domain-containing protein
VEARVDVVTVPVFNPRFRVWALPECVFLMSEDDAILLRGRAYVLLAPLIDGQRTAADLTQALDGQCSRQSVEAALERMSQKRYVLEAAAARAADTPAEAFWLAQGVDADVQRTRLAAVRVAVHAVGDVDAAPVLDALVAAGVAVTRTGDESLFVVLTDDYARPALKAFNERFLAEGRAWLLAKPGGSAFWLGPLFVPGTTGCWLCLRQRITLRRPVEALLQRRHGTSEPVAPATHHLPGATTAAAHQLAEAVRQYALTGTHPLVGQVFTLAPLSLDSRLHPLTRRPQCPACGEPGRFAVDPPPFEIRSQPTTVADDSGTRAIPADVMLQRYEHHVSPVTGIVGAIREMGDPSDPTRVYGSSYNHAFTHDDLHFFRMHVRSNAGGKGSTDLQARASALGESLERYSGLYQGYEPTRVASYRELGASAVHPRILAGFSDRQFAERARANAGSTGTNLVPAPVDEDRPMHWTPVWSLTRGERRYLPTCFCYYGFTLEPREHVVCFSDSNGCAGGATREDALLQGLMELVERDAVALWWYNRVSRPGLDLTTVDHPHVRRLEAYHRSIGRRLWALDLTADTGIPVFGAVSAAADGRVGDVAVGFAAHLDPLIALRRALNECGQTTAALAFLRRMSGGLTDEPTVAWLSEVDPVRHTYLQPDPAVPPASLARHPRLSTGDVAEDVRLAMGRLEALGLEVLALDQTRPDCGFAVVKAVVPGLCHFWPRFGIPRLYEAPVRLGWLSAPTAEEDMNPLPMLL